VTGHEAHEVSRIAHLFKERLDRVETMLGKEKELALKLLAVVRSTLDVLFSYYKRLQRNWNKLTYP
jgi:hypothetical protein